MSSLAERYRCVIERMTRRELINHCCRLSEQVGLIAQENASLHHRLSQMQEPRLWSEEAMTRDEAPLCGLAGLDRELASRVGELVA